MTVSPSNNFYDTGSGDIVVIRVFVFDSIGHSNQTDFNLSFSGVNDAPVITSVSGQVPTPIIENELYSSEISVQPNKILYMRSKVKFLVKRELLPNFLKKLEV